MGSPMVRLDADCGPGLLAGELLGQRALVVVRHDLHEAAELVLPALEQAGGHRGAGAVAVLLDQRAQLVAPRPP